MFKILPFIALFSAITFTCVAQKLKTTKQVSGIYKEVYLVDKSTGFRQGRYSVINMHTKDTVALGNFKNSARVGEWKFLDPKSSSTYIIYDYTKNEAQYLNDAFLPDSFFVKSGDDFEVKKVDRPLIYTGFKDELNWRIAQQIDIPIEHLIEGNVGVSILNFIVDEMGAVKEVKIVSGFNKEIEQEINKIVMQLPGRFLPAIYNGQPVESSFYVRANIGLPVQSFDNTKLPPYIIHLDLISKEVGRTTTKRVGYATKPLSPAIKPTRN
ncbi:energy transducer TonB [uncultured Draconibacterium sp.]|uniref:energy transducer TonB n=1 Tax=uncultured Draconibacterium sp. TaxID=1573823 RepID=UPI003217ECE1